MRRRTNRPIKIRCAAEMRRHPTPGEVFAWELLRNRRCLGLKFRRQHILQGFIVDFYCPNLGLALEIDGGVHASAERMEFDASRTRLLGRIGVRVVRVSNDELTLNRLEEVVRPYLKHSPSPHSGEGGGGEASTTVS